MRGLVTFVLASGLVVASCTPYAGSAESMDVRTVARESGWLRVRGVPIVRQEHTSDCGLAALSAVLGFWGVPDDREQIEESLGKAEARPPGVLARELRDYARSRSLSAYVFEGTFHDLQHELEIGRPVIVGVHKRLRSGEALAHYEVVVGYHAATQRVLTMDPAHGLRRNSVSGFIDEWRGSNQLILVVFPQSPDARALR